MKKKATKIPSSFARKVYEATKQIPKGKVATYGQIAGLIGQTKASRAVGQALHRNPYAPMVPCHRVVATSGHLHGFASGLVDKEKMLRQEGIEIKYKRINLKKFLWGLK